MWQTDDVRSARPTVRDEIRMALDYFEFSLFDTLPVLYAEVAATLEAVCPPAAPAEFHRDSSGRNSPMLAELPLLIDLWLVDRRRPRWESVRRQRRPPTAESLALSRELLFMRITCRRLQVHIRAARQLDESGARQRRHFEELICSGISIHARAQPDRRQTRPELRLQRTLPRTSRLRLLRCAAS